MEWFTRSTRADMKETTVTLLKSGSLNINASTYKTYFMDDGNVCYEFVEFGFDRENNTVGIRPLKDKVAGAYAIRQTTSGATVSAKAFLKHFEIEHEKSRSYVVEWDKEAKVLTFTLKDQSP